MDKVRFEIMTAPQGGFNWKFIVEGKIICINFEKASSLSECLEQISMTMEVTPSVYFIQEVNKGSVNSLIMTKKNG